MFDEKTKVDLQQIADGYEYLAEQAEIQEYLDQHSYCHQALKHRDASK